MFPSATFDWASEVISHIKKPFSGKTSIVDLVTSFEEHTGLEFQVTLSSSNVSQAWALTVKEDVPETLYLYNESKALVGVIVDGNGSSSKSNVRIIFDSPEPLADIPKSSLPLFPSFVFALFESIVASGTPGRLPVSSNTEPSNRVTD